MMGTVVGPNVMHVAGVTMSELAGFRLAKDAFFAASGSSPLTPAQQEGFRGLSYYAPNLRFVYDAMLEPQDGRLVRLITPAGDQEMFRRAGTIRIEVDGAIARLTLFHSERGGDLFAPFRDTTNGTETCGCGRHLKIRPPEDGHVLVNFNYAFNPNCAYNDRWTYPLPPQENWMNVPIRAGERLYAHDAGDDDHRVS